MQNIDTHTHTNTHTQVAGGRGGGNTFNTGIVFNNKPLVLNPSCTLKLSGEILKSTADQLSLHTNYIRISIPKSMFLSLQMTLLCSQG